MKGLFGNGDAKLKAHVVTSSFFASLPPVIRDGSNLTSRFITENIRILQFNFSTGFEPFKLLLMLRGKASPICKAFIIKESQHC